MTTLFSSFNRVRDFSHWLNSNVALKRQMRTDKLETHQNEAVEKPKSLGNKFGLKQIRKRLFRLKLKAQSDIIFKSRGIDLNLFFPSYEKTYSLFPNQVFNKVNKWTDYK